MGSRVYILLDVVESKAEEVTEILRGTADVKLVDLLEGKPNVVMVLQAQSRRELAELTNQALASVGKVTEAPRCCQLQMDVIGIFIPAGRCKVKTHHNGHYLKSTGAKEG